MCNSCGCNAGQDDGLLITPQDGDQDPKQRGIYLQNPDLPARPTQQPVVQHGIRYAGDGDYTHCCDQCGGFVYVENPDSVVRATARCYHCGAKGKETGWATCILSIGWDVADTWLERPDGDEPKTTYPYRD